MTLLPDENQQIATQLHLREAECGANNLRRSA